MDPVVAAVLRRVSPRSREHVRTEPKYPAERLILAMSEHVAVHLGVAEWIPGIFQNEHGMYSVPTELAHRVVAAIREGA